MTPEELKLFPYAGKGHYFEDFSVGQVFEHRRSRTVLAADSMLFTTFTVQVNPLYFDAERARALGHETIVLNPFLVFGTIFGLTVEDLSEKGGAFLGIDDLSFHRPVYPDETLSARSTVMSKRESSKNPDLGIVTWHTEGFSAGKPVLAFTRSNMVVRRPACPI